MWKKLPLAVDELSQTEFSLQEEQTIIQLHAAQSDIHEVGGINNLNYNYLIPKYS